MKFIIFLAVILFQLISINAKTLYVNGVTGKDSDPVFNGLSEKTALKTIQKALNKADINDIIIVEGKNDGKEIIYYEKINIEDKDNIRIKGKNKPILSGKNKELVKPPYIGITIGIGDIKIQGFKISDFLDENIPEIGFAGGAAIYSKSGNTGIDIEDNEITNCNWGIIFYETEASIINGNKIDSMHIIQNISSLNGGVGIMLFAKRKFIQGVEIGTKKANIISNSDYAGIFIGSSDSITIAELTKIQNNKLTNSKGYGIIAQNFSGMVSIEKNLFEGNGTALYLGGMMLDTYFGENTFNGSVSASEIVTNTAFNGSFLYDIWKNNRNIFKIPTFAAVENDNNSIKLNKDKRYIRNVENMAQSDVQTGGQLQKLPPLK
jgi:nitrous oxidase accessory protein NosD